jgi:hypothetical protein
MSVFENSTSNLLFWMTLGQSIRRLPHPVSPSTHQSAATSSVGGRPIRRKVVGRGEAPWPCNPNFIAAEWEDESRILKQLHRSY